MSGARERRVSAVWRLSVQAAAVEGRLTKSAGNKQSLMTQVYTFHLHGLHLAHDVLLTLLAWCMYIILQVCAYFLFTNVHHICQRMEPLVLFWTNSILHRPPLCSCGANVHLPYKRYQAVRFSQSASVSGCSSGMHMFWISYHLAVKSLRLLAGLASLAGLTAQHWPPRFASGTAALAPHPTAVERREETRQTWRLAYLTSAIKEHGIQVISRPWWKFNLPVKGLKNIKDKSALLNTFLLFKNDLFMFELLRWATPICVMLLRD